MLKKTITYEDFDGKEVTEEHYFHLSQADLVEMEMEHDGGLHAYLQQIVDAEDGAAIISEFKRLILTAYGHRSGDSKRFIKTQAIRDEFQSSEAYSTLFMELCTNPEAASAFVNGIVPGGIKEEMSKITKPYSTFETNPKPDSTVLTTAEILEMDSDELKSGLATGRYKLSA